MIVLGSAPSRRLFKRVNAIVLSVAAILVISGVGTFAWTKGRQASAARTQVARYETLLSRRDAAAQLLASTDRLQEVNRYFVNAPNSAAAAALVQQQVSRFRKFRDLKIQDLSAAPRDNSPDEILVTLSASGTLADVAELLSEINTAEPHLFLESLALSRQRGSQADEWQTQVSLRLFALVQGDARP